MVWTCNIYNKNAIGRVKCSAFYFAITKPTYTNNNGEIDKIALCEICVNELELDNFKKKKTLVDNKRGKYELIGLENGQFYRKRLIFKFLIFSQKLIW